MNRKERRQKGITSEDYSKIQKQAIDTTVTVVLAAVLLHLRDKHKWGQQRAIKLLESVDKEFEAYQQGYVTLKELVDQVSKELEIEIR